ncbi:glycosyltransferase [Cytophagaceae bacterium ABcell3]|nr:glycosyltransferase [Cytophagaceae bacterium ABcell3]
MSDKKTVIVLGMHRSGTLAISTVLEKLGIHPSLKNQISESNDNTLNSFEKRDDIGKINDLILEEINCNWFSISNYSPEKFDSEISEKTKGYIKNLVKKTYSETHTDFYLSDPRFCLTGKVWEKYLSFTAYIFVYRNPIEVAQLLREKNRFSLDFSLALWEKYVKSGVTQIDNQPYLLVDYNSLTKEPELIYEQIILFLSAHGFTFKSRNPKEMAITLDSDLSDNSQLEQIYLTGEIKEIYQNLKNKFLQKINKNVSLKSALTLKNTEGIYKEFIDLKSLADKKNAENSKFSEANSKIKFEKEKAEAELEKLSHWIEDLQKAQQEILRSYRWKLGNKFINAYKNLLLKNNQGNVGIENFENTIQKYNIWKKSKLSERPRPKQGKLIISILTPSTNIHGGTKRLMMIAKLLQEKGHVVNFIRQYSGSKSDWFNFSVPVIDLYFERPGSIDSLEERLPDADIFITYGNNKSAEIFSKLPESKGLKFLLFMHFGVHDLDLDIKNASIKDFHLLATTSWIAEQIHKHTGRNAKTISFGIHADQFVETPQDRSNRIGSLYHKDEWKRSRDVIKSFQILKKDIKDLTMVMFGQEKSPELPEGIEYHYNPDQSELREIYSSCSAWITASLYEGVGMCSVEAMLCKTPLITTDTGGSRDFCTNKNSLLVEKKNPSSIAEAVKKILSDPALARKIANQAYKDINDFTWEKSITKLETELLKRFSIKNPEINFTTDVELTIGIPIHNQVDYVRDCIKSIQENTSGEYEVILIDDVSDEETKSYLKELELNHHNVKYLRNTERKGFPYNCNLIITNSRGRYICLLNSDTIVTKNWNKFLADGISKNANCVITGPSTSYGIAKNFDGVVQQLDEVHTQRFDMTYEQIQDFGKDLYEREKEQYQETEYLNGFCLFFKRELINEIGFFDTSFGLGSREEVQFIDRIRLSGSKPVWVKHAYVHHYGHRSFNSYAEESKLLWEKNKELYFKNKNQKILVNTTNKRVLFVYNAKYSSSTRKRTFEIIKELSRYVKVKAKKWHKIRDTHFDNYDIFVFQRIGALNEKISPSFLKTVLKKKKKGGNKKTFIYDIDDYIIHSQNDMPLKFIKNCDYVTTSTNHLQKLLLKFNPNTVCLRNGIDTDRFLRAEPKDLNSEYVHIICFSIGAAGLEAMNELSEKLEGQKVKIHFFSSEKYEFPVHHNLNIYDSVDLDELFGFIKGADYVINWGDHPVSYIKSLAQQYNFKPEDVDNFINAKSGLKYYNAGIAKKVFITTPYPVAYSEMICHNQNGFLVNTIDEIVPIIAELEKNIEKKKEIGYNAYLDVNTNYSTKTTVLDYLSFLEKF